MVIFLYGTDSFRRSARVRIFEEAFQKKHDAIGVNSAKIDGAQFSIDEFRKFAKSAGLFSTKRFVVFTNPFALSVDDQELLLSELESIPSDTILCFTADAPSQKKNRLFQRLCKADTVEEYADLSPAQLRAFMEQECKKNGATIERDAAERLVVYAGTDLWKLANTLHSLVHYSKKISLEIVQQFIEEAVDNNIF
ncbi:MAG TPA: hypothetical protein VJB65_03385, partial [Patescibacteria group bacterium]|nr:hypothetical protein [Patescibacteria group bacterium]